MCPLQYRSFTRHRQILASRFGDLCAISSNIARRRSPGILNAEDPMGVVRDPAVNEPMIRIRLERAARVPFRRGIPETALVGS